MPTRIQNLYNNIQKNKRGQNVLQFPSDIETAGHGNIIRFNINVPEGSKYLGKLGQNNSIRVNASTGDEVPVYRREGSSSMASGTDKRFSGNSIRIDTVMDFYMPPEVQTNYQTQWNAKSLGSTGGIIDALMDIKAGNMGDFQDYIYQTAMNTVIGATNAASPFEVKDAAALARQGISNPYMEILFEGVENRTFAFTFKMIPRNAQEQETIYNIVKTFKFHQAPEIKFEGKNQYWLFPSEFDIKFMHRGEDHPWLFNISTCALTGFSVDYSPEGQYSSHADGSPFATSISLQFTEMEIHTKETISDGGF